MLKHMMRRGPFGGFGPGPRMFGRGDLKYALLGLLQERPKHGYEMIKELEERSGGFYTPSAGAVYPTLQMLEDRGWVSVELVEGKKVYSITDAGKQALTEEEQRRGPGPQPGPEGGPGPRGWGHHRGPRGPFGGGPFGSPEQGAALRQLMHQGREVAQLLRIAVMDSHGDPARLQELQGIIEHARQELLTFLSKTQPGGQPGSEQPPSDDGGSVEQI